MIALDRENAGRALGVLRSLMIFASVVFLGVCVVHFFNVGIGPLKIGDVWFFVFSGGYVLLLLVVKQCCKVCQEVVGTEKENEGM